MSKRNESISKIEGQPVRLAFSFSARAHHRENFMAVSYLKRSFDRIFSVDFFADSEPEPIQDNFQLEVSYAYIDRNEAQRNDCFLLDFVAFDKLTEFGNAIDHGAKAAAFLASD